MSLSYVTNTVRKIGIPLALTGISFIPLACGSGVAASSESIKLYESKIPERCVEIINGGATLGGTGRITLGYKSTAEYLFCRNPEGGYSRFERATEWKPDQWNEIRFLR